MASDRQVRFRVCSVCGEWGMMVLEVVRHDDGVRLRMVNGAVYRLGGYVRYLHGGHEFSEPFYEGAGVWRER
ncbi:MAG: hypothetical protein QXH59_10040 [Candidatus Caldarchaeum sp.]